MKTLPNQASLSLDAQTTGTKPADSFQTRYAMLNPEQKQAVDTIDGPVMVVAGPGSGKTELLSLRVANILRQTDMNPSNILCLTFTDAAATNMRTRLFGLIGAEAFRVAIHTFHSFGAEIINRHPERFYNGAVFTPADEFTQIELLEELIIGLEHDNPLRSVGPDNKFVYLRSAKSAIENLKQAGLTPGEFRAILDHNERFINRLAPDIDQTFSVTLSAKKLDSIEALLDTLGFTNSDSFPVEHFEPLSVSLERSLRAAYQQVEESGKGAALSAWKSKYTEKNPDGQRVLKDIDRLPKLRALADLYEQYQSALHQRGYIDFPDLLLQTLQAMADDEMFQMELQEQYQYILVDEFQDTNDAQMRLVRRLMAGPVNEGRPNVMVVGDDDQAIYRFQGAEVANIVQFAQSVRDPVIITLTHNYRSTQEILDMATGIVNQSSERLSDIMTEVEKNLVASNPTLGRGQIVHRGFATSAHEYYWVASEIKRQIDSGAKPSDIAIIARKHEQLEQVSLFLRRAGIPVRYERQQSVLGQPHIAQLIQMSRFVTSLARARKVTADEYLPEILSYPFWGLDRKQIWQLSKTSYETRQRWLDCMLTSSDTKLVAIANFFLELSGRTQHEPLEYLLEALIGAHQPLLPDAETGADEELASNNRRPQAMTSPFKDYYFSRDNFAHHRDQYILLLSGLKTFIAALREYKRGEPLSLDDLVTFVDLRQKNGVDLTDNSPFISASDAVEVMTAHKSKGQEFDTVFVLSCQDDIWMKSSGRNYLPLPLNLPLAPDSDSTADHIRLFYVALTRAKRHLFITSFATDDKGKETPRLQLLPPLPPENVDTSTSDDLVKILETATAAPRLSGPPSTDERAILLPLLETYKMSATHLNNFLNVVDAGPETFLQDNLLRFPHPRSASAAYGTAIHGTLEQIYLELKKTGHLVDVSRVQDWFESRLRDERLSDDDLRIQLGRGRSALATFYEHKQHTFDPSHEVEYNFNHDEVHIGEAHITGKIDKLVKVDDATFDIYDYKTGKVSESWQGKDAPEKIKLYGWRRQLTFYKLLIENSRSFGGKFEAGRGVIEFVEPSLGRLIELSLPIEREEADRLKALIEAVFTRIQNLDFPDISKYPKTLDGIKQFEEDLLT